MRTRKLERVAALLAAALVAAAAAPAQAGDPVRGQQIYRLCKQCHGDNGAGIAVAKAPAIAGLDEWYVERQLNHFRNAARGVHPEDVGGLRMYPMSLTIKSDEDSAALAAYVASMTPVELEPTLSGGDAKKGEQYYAVCASCHGANGAGNEALNAPPLVGASDWYLLDSLKKYKAGIRGGNPKNPIGSVMIGMSNTLPDEQAMLDVIAYISTLDGAQ